MFIKIYISFQFNSHLKGEEKKVHLKLTFLWFRASDVGWITVRCWWNFSRWSGFCGFAQPRRLHSETQFKDSSCSQHVCLWFHSLVTCVCVPPSNVPFPLWTKNLMISWGVSTNIHAVNKREAGNAVVNVSRVIIRWFCSLRSKAANSKAISNLKGKS